MHRRAFALKSAFGGKLFPVLKCILEPTKAHANKARHHAVAVIKEDEVIRELFFAIIVVFKFY